MPTYHSLQPGVIHPPHMKNVGYSGQLLQLFQDWLLPIDSTKATPSGKMSNTLYIIF